MSISKVCLIISCLHKWVSKVTENYPTIPHELLKPSSLQAKYMRRIPYGIGIGHGHRSQMQLHSATGQTLCFANHSLA